MVTVHKYKHNLTATHIYTKEDKREAIFMYVRSKSEIQIGVYGVAETSVSGITQLSITKCFMLRSRISETRQTDRPTVLFVCSK
jgi:hypothetical protein